MKKIKISIKKYGGDDSLSYGVFRAEHVKGMGSIVFCGQATPIFAGCSRHEADYYKKKIESGEINIGS